jgi:uncharacterized RDD family membrane protein YckC
MNLNQEVFQVTPDIHASKGKRFINYIIDRILFYVIIFGLTLLVALVSEFFNIPEILDFLIRFEDLNWYEDFIFTAVLFSSYYFLFENFTQRTIGKFITKTKVVDVNGNKPNATAFFYRSLMRFIPFEPFSFLGAEARGWHDTATATFVIDLDKFEIKKTNFDEMRELGELGVLNDRI